MKNELGNLADVVADVNELQDAALVEVREIHNAQARECGELAHISDRIAYDYDGGDSMLDYGTQD